MDKDKIPLDLGLILFLGIISASLCIACEVNKTKRNDLKLDNNLCYLSGSSAAGLGISALTFLAAAHFFGNIIVCRNFFRRRKRTDEDELISSVPAIIFMFLSWVSFGIALVLISSATSMNKVQPYGQGWLDGECYLVKDGVFVGSAILVLLAVGSTILSAVVALNIKTCQIVPKCTSWTNLKRTTTVNIEITNKSSFFMKKQSIPTIEN
ncbi:protein MODIFYING WALL LIGNIN-1-like [Impatiens glandulifera]|uniref:protein MODIFYING WALL LIGNIN-1-like n=1 Tax=Impatiens glandulifera TaxID=253017 RepID=UPI001FB0FA93|nr:protein MODIFYING WALL LIGNIN-1-like [Impatiens glandulifera]